MARNLSHNLKRMVAGLCAVMVVATQMIGPAGSSGLFSDSSIVASAEGGQQYEVSPDDQESVAGTVTESQFEDGAPDLFGKTYTATANPGYKFVKFVYDIFGEQKESTSNTISFGYADAEDLGSVKAVFVEKSDSTYNVTAKTGLSYDGEEQELVETTGAGGTVKYALSNGATVYNKRETKVKKVVVGDAFIPENGDQNGFKLPPKYTKFILNGTTTYDAWESGIEISYYSSARIYGKDGSFNVPDGYDGFSITAIDEANGIITFEAIKSSEYDPFAGLVWDTTAPKGTGAGDYYVCWKVEGNDEYNGKDPAMVTATIAKADSTYNVTAKTGLSFNGEEQELVETTGEGGTIGYAKVPDGKSVGDVVKRDVWEAIVPEVGKVYTPDLNGSENGQYGVLFDPSYSVFVDNQGYTQGGDFNPVRLMYDNDSEKYQIVEYDSSQDTSVSRDIKDGCNAILVTDVDEAHNVIVGTFVNSADYVSSDSLTWSEDIPTATAVGSYDVYWKVDGDDNYNDKAPAKVTAKIAGSEATVTVKGKDFVVTDSKGKEAINPTTPAGEGTDAVYTLSNGAYRIFSNETLVSRDDRFEMSERKGSYYVGGKAFSYRYTVDLVDINNDDDVPDEILVEHVHEVSVKTNTDKDAVVAECIGETGETITNATLAEFNIADSYYFGDYPTEDDVTIDNDNTFGYTASVSDFYFTEKGETAKLQPSDMELGKQYSVNMYITVYDENGEEVGVYRIFKDVNYAARPFNECTFKIGDTTLEVQGDAETGYYVEAPENILTYNKQSQLPNVTVTAGASSTALVKDTDFVITSEGETKNAGAHTATIKAVDGSAAYDQTPVTVKFTIDKAQNEMTITGVNRIYNGEALDTSIILGTNDYTYTDPQGVLGEEEVEVSVPKSSTYDRISAGKQVVDFNIKTPNYVDKTITVESNISKRDATITTSEEQQSVTYGDSFSIAYTLEEANEDRGVVETDISKLATGMLTFTGDKGKMTNIGSYNEFVLKTQNPPAASKNYNLTLNNENAGTLVIGKRALTADMFSAGERIYDNKDLTIPLKAVDNVGGTNVLQASDYVVSGQTTGKTPGTYTVTINASENGNYSLESPITLTWKVVPAEIERFINVNDSYSYNTEIAPNMAVHTSGNDPKVGFTPGGSIKVAYYKVKDGVTPPAADADEDTFRAFIADSSNVTSVSSFDKPSIGNYILKAYSTSSYVTGDAFKLVNIHKYNEGINNKNVTVWNLYDRPYDGVGIKLGSPYEVCISHKGPAESEHYLGVKKSGFYKINYAEPGAALGVGKTPTKEKKYDVTSFSHINIVDASGDVKHYSGDSIKSILVSGDGNDIKLYDHDDILRAICYDHDGDKDVWVVTQAENGTLTIKAYTPAELLDDDIAQGNITPTAVNAGDYVLMMKLGDDQYEDCFYSRNVTITKRVATVTPNANQKMVYGDDFSGSVGSVGYTTSNLVSGESLNVSNIVEVGQKVQSSTESQTPAYNFDPESMTNPAGQYDYKLKSGIESEINPNYTVKLDTTNKFTVEPKDVESDDDFIFSPIGYSVVYNASEQTVNPTFTYGGSEYNPYHNIASGTDYDITGTFKGTNVGEYTMTLTAKGNYTGKFNVSWNITAANITSVVVDPDKFDYTAANDPQKSGIKVNGVQTAGQETSETTDDKFEPLTEGKDYEIRYISADTIVLEVTDEIFNAASTNVKDIGSYVAIVKGKGNYQGYTMSNVFEIKKAQSSSDHYDVTFNGGKDRVYNGESVANGDFAVSANEKASAAEKENPAITGIEYYKVPTGTAITPETDLEKLVEGVDADATEIGPNVEVSSSDVGKYLKDGDYTVANITLIIDGQYFAAGVHEGKFKINGGQFSTDNGGFTVGNVSDNKRWKITDYDGMLYIDAVDPPVEGLTPMTTTPVVDQLEPGNRTITAEDKGKYLVDGEYIITNSGYLKWFYTDLISANTKFVINGSQITITEDGKDYSSTKNAGENKCWKITEVNEQGKVTIEAVDAPADVPVQPKDAGTYIAKLTVKSDSTEPATIYKAIEIEKKAVNITLGHNDITWGTLIDKNTVYTIDPNNGFVSKDDAPDFDSWFDVSRTEQGGAAIVGFDFNDASHNNAAAYNITSATAGDESGKTKVKLYNENPDNNYTLNVTEGTLTVKPYELQADDVTLDTASFKYDGEVKAPVVTAKVKYGKKNGTTLSYDYKELTLGTKRAPGEDGYIGGTSKMSEAGVWSLLVVGDGNFTGTIRKDWTIDKAAMKVELDDIAERPYDGTATEVTAKLKYTDVTVNEVGPGTVTLSASDIGKYLKDGKYTFKNAVRGIHDGEFAPGFECTVSGGQISVDYGNETVSYGDASGNKRWKITGFEYNAITLEVVNDPTAVDPEEAGVTVTYKYEKQVTSGDALGTWEEVSEAKDAGTYKVTATVQGNDNFDVSEEDATAAKVFEITQRDVNVTLNTDDLTKSNGYKDGTVHVTYGEGDVVASDEITLPETIDIGTGVADGTAITADNEAFADIKTALGSNYKLVVSGDPIVKIKAARLASVEVKTSYIKQSGGDEFVSPVFIAKDENGNDFDVSKLVVSPVDEVNVAKSYKITVSDEATPDDTTDDFKLVWDVKEIGMATLQSSSSDLGKNLRLNFKFTLTDNVVEDTNAYFTYTYNGTTENVKVSDITKDANNYYVLSVPITPSMAHENVNVKLFNGDDVQIPMQTKKGNAIAESGYELSMFTYVDALANAYPEGNTWHKLAVATKDYCIAANNFLAGGSAGNTVSSAVDTVVVSDFDEYIMTSTEKITGLSKVNLSLDCQNVTSINLKLTLASGAKVSNYTCTLDGKKVSLKKSGTNEYTVSIDNVYASQLGTKHTFKMVYGNEEYVTDFSGLSYVAAIMNKEALAANKVYGDFAKAVYLYNKNAVAAFE